MKKSELRLIVNLFKYYYSSVFNVKNYRFAITDSKEKTIENFIAQIKELSNTKTLQEDYLRQYFEFQFNHWYRYDSKSSVKSVQIEWIVGKKAIARWEKVDKKIISFVVQKNLKTDVNLRSRLKKENWDSLLLNLNPVEESEKERFFGTVKGYYNCLIGTTLYNHKSPLCMQCFKSKDCRKELKIQFPKIYKKRGYESN